VLIKKCAWCDTNLGIDHERFIGRVAVSHGMCDSCYRLFEDELQQQDKIERRLKANQLGQG